MLLEVNFCNDDDITNLAWSWDVGDFERLHEAIARFRARALHRSVVRDFLDLENGSVDGFKSSLQKNARQKLEQRKCVQEVFRDRGRDDSFPCAHRVKKKKFVDSTARLDEPSDKLLMRKQRLWRLRNKIFVNGCDTAGVIRSEPRREFHRRVVVDVVVDVFVDVDNDVFVV